MIVEDNTFDYLVRDHLTKECEDRHLLPFWGYLNPSAQQDRQLMLDMITYCSRGNKEAAVLNLIATKDFIHGFMIVGILDGRNWWSDAWDFMFEFWKKCFIKIKVLVQKQESLPPPTYTEVISRDYGRFLQHHNFANFDALKAESRVAIDSLKNDSENYNNIYKVIMGNGDPNDA